MRARKNNTPSLTAGLDMNVSPRLFTASFSNSGPARITWTSPSSLAKYSLPSAATPEPVNPERPLPSCGQMIKDQTGAKEAAESHDDMVRRYQKILY